MSAGALWPEPDPIQVSTPRVAIRPRWLLPSERPRVLREFTEDQALAAIQEVEHTLVCPSCFELRWACGISA